jgi:hypothetical protein
MPGECWTVKEIDSLIAQVVFEKRRLPDLCIPGRGEAAINNQRRRLKEGGRLEGVFTGRTLRPWTICELNTLRNFTNGHGFSAAFISQLQLVEGRSKDSISGMMHRHGLGNDVARSRSKCAHRLTDGQREALITFLQCDGRLIPSSHVAERWGIAQKTVNGYRRRLGTSLSWQEARSSEDYQQRREILRRKFVRQMRERWRRWRLRTKGKLEDLRDELLCSPCPPARRPCMVCQEAWFATKDFYHVQHRRQGYKVKVSMSRTCRICRSAQRRARARDSARAARF